MALCSEDVLSDRGLLLLLMELRISLPLYSLVMPDSSAGVSELLLHGLVSVMLYLVPYLRGLFLAAVREL